MNQALRILFSGYLIVLSCLYCNDKQTCAVSDTSVVAGSAGAHDDHEQDTENCSPFCICACCGQTAASTINLLAINSNLQSSTTLFNVYTQNFPAEVSLSVWQPHKLG